MPHPIPAASGIPPMRDHAQRLRDFDAYEARQLTALLGVSVTVRGGVARVNSAALLRAVSALAGEG